MSERIDSLQILRALAFTGIFVSHCGVVDYGLGAFGVSIFLVLSGFLMSYCYIPKDEVPQKRFQFACKKVKKLYPLHIVMLVLCIIYEVLCREGSVKIFDVINLFPIILHAGMIQIWCPSETIYATLNTPSWYLGVCFFCFILFPIVIKIIKKYSSVVTAFRAIICLVFTQLLIAVIAKLFLSDLYSDFFSMKYAVYFFPPSRFIDFAIGLNLGYIFLKVRSNPPKCGLKSILLIFAVLSSICACICYEHGFLLLGKEYIRYTLNFTVPSCLVVYLLACMKCRRSFIQCLFVWIGDISPYSFLIHMVVIKYIRLVNNNLYVVAMVSFVITIIFANFWARVVKQYLS